MQDLWAEFVGAPLSTEENGRTGGIRQRRLTEQAVLTELRAWLLQDYLLPYATSLGATRIFRRCCWIDGLGHNRAAVQTAPVPSETTTPGKRGRQKAREQTPPLPPALQPVAALAQQLAQLERPMGLQGFVLTGKSSKRKATGKIAREAQNGAQPGEAVIFPKEGGLLTATWPELAPALLPALEQNAAIFLLDPLKDGLFRYADLVPLYQRTAPTELFLWLSHKQLETRLLPRLQTSEGAAALTNLLRGDRWKSLLVRESNANQQLLIEGLIQLCAESMQSHFLSVQRLAFPMLTGPAHVEDAPFTLLFATRRQDSLSSLNDAVCLRQRRLLAASQQGVLNEEWFATQRAEQSVAAWETLLRKTRALGQTSRVRRWPDLRQQLLLAHFGQYTLSEYDRIITTLLARGEVRCEWQKGSQETDEGRLPGQRDLLLWPAP
ncbi:MAG TPA: hypothetical protein VFV38_14155 [Ktedonobacteraceae bacterium]|nr:hypothetical protein [Ktedonobacteraceae bacterium]